MLKRISTLGKYALVGCLVGSTIAYPLYAIEAPLYLGSLHKIFDISHIPTILDYNGALNASGHLVNAADGHAVQKIVYLPLSKGFDNIPIQTRQDCPIGKPCFKVEGHGQEVFVYNYDYQLHDNPYGMLQSQQIYIQDKPGHYQEIEQSTYHYNRTGEVLLKVLTQRNHTTHIVNQYDALGRLISSGANQYNYDANGNMLSREDGQYPVSLTLNGVDESVSAQGVSHIQFDGNGNQLTAVAPDSQTKQAKQTGGYIFNARNQLVGYTNSENTVQLTYRYTANGVRWAQQDPLIDQALYYYSQGSQVLDITHSVQGQLQGTAHYFLGQGRVSYIVTRSNDVASSTLQPSYYIAGNKGNVLGQVQERNTRHIILTQPHTYSPYGMALAPSTQQSMKDKQFKAFSLQGNAGFGYDGEQQNPLTRLTFLRARYDDSYTGRFVSRDSYNLLNNYMSFKEDPMSKVDPQGHMPGWFKKYAGISLMGAGAAFSLISPFLPFGAVGATISYSMGALFNTSYLTMNMVQKYTTDKAAFWGDALALGGMTLTSAAWSIDAAYFSKMESAAQETLTKLSESGTDEGISLQKAVIKNIQRKKFIFNFVANFADNTLGNAGISMQGGTTSNIHQSILLGMASAGWLALSSAGLSAMGIWESSALKAFGGGFVRGAVAEGINTLVYHKSAAQVLTNAAIGGVAGGLLYGSTNAVFRDTRLPGVGQFGAQLSLSTVWQTDVGPVSKKLSPLIANYL